MHVVWNAPPECPTGAQVEHEIGRLLASSTVGSNDVSATATVTKTAKAWAVVLSTDVRGVHGSRSLTASTCDALAHATAIVLALTIDPNAKAQTEEEEKAPAPPEAAAAPPPVVANDAGAVEPLPPASDASPPSSSDSTFALGANVVGMIGALPHLAFAAELAAAWASDTWRLELSAAYFPPVRELVDARRGGDLRLLVGAVRGCKIWRWTFGAELGPCVAVEAGMMRGEGIGVRAPGSYDTPWFGLQAGGLAALELGKSPIWLVLTVDGEVPLTRYRFALDAVGVVHHVNPVVGRASLGAEVRFR